MKAQYKRAKCTDQDKEETHLTSRSLVATPDCNIDLNLIVSGNGSFTVIVSLGVSQKMWCAHL